MPTSIKHERLQSLIKRDIILIMQREIKNNVINSITVHEVRLSNDFSVAKVYFSVFSIEDDRNKNIRKAEQALDKYNRQIRSKLSHKIEIRKCPELVFKYDTSYDAAKKIEDILKNNI